MDIMEMIVYFTSLVIYFAIVVRVLRAIHFEDKFEKFKMWEIKTAYFLIALIAAHTLAEIMVRFSSLIAGIFGV